MVQARRLLYGRRLLEPERRSVRANLKLTFHCWNLDAELNKNTDSGFSAGLVDDENPFEWQVILTGPPDTW